MEKEKNSFKWYEVLMITFIVATIILLIASKYLEKDREYFAVGYCFASVIGLVISTFICILTEHKIKVLYLISIGIVIIGCIGYNSSIHFIEDNTTGPIIQGMHKPIIYLYPEKETEINVTLGNPEQLTHTYPKYDERAGWNVTAEPNGNLLYGDKNLYALYWEGKSRFDNKIQDDGFIVKGEDTIEFLEEKLSILGLNEREAEEFIVYWLPQMEDNKYNYIRFETREEIDYNMPLNITPQPDALIRIVMDWCEIDSESEADRLSHYIKEQELTTPKRKGFVAVEWGGSRIKK